MLFAWRSFFYSLNGNGYPHTLQIAEYMLCKTGITHHFDAVLGELLQNKQGKGQKREYNDVDFLGLPFVVFRQIP